MITAQPVLISITTIRVEADQTALGQVEQGLARTTLTAVCDEKEGFACRTQFMVLGCLASRVKEYLTEHS